MTKKTQSLRVVLAAGFGVRRARQKVQVVELISHILLFPCPNNLTEQISSGARAMRCPGAVDLLRRCGTWHILLVVQPVAGEKKHSR